MKNNRIHPPRITGGETISDIVNNHFNAYNAARLREACKLFAEEILKPDVTVGFSLSGAMTPAGIGPSCIVPLIEAGMIDWMVSTGANLYHDLHYGMDMELRRSSPYVDDVKLKNDRIVRIYDILFDFQVLLDTDAYVMQVIGNEEFEKPMGTAEFHNLLGKYLSAREDELGIEGQSLLAAAWKAGVPIYTPSPGDSSLGLNVASNSLLGSKLEFLPSLDVNETTAIVLAAKRSGGKSAAVMVGGGACKNFILQTEPQIQEILGLPESGHDYFVQFTDSRPDTGGLSGATPSEAMTWGKIDPEGLPSAIVCYLDATVALPILTSYALACGGERPQRRLYDKRGELLDRLRKEVAKWGRKTERGTVPPSIV